MAAMLQPQCPVQQRRPNTLQRKLPLHATAGLKAPPCCLVVTRPRPRQPPPSRQPPLGWQPSTRLGQQRQDGLAGVAADDGHVHVARVQAPGLGHKRVGAHHVQGGHAHHLQGAGGRAARRGVQPGCWIIGGRALGCAGVWRSECTTPMGGARRWCAPSSQAEAHPGLRLRP